MRKNESGSPSKLLGFKALKAAKLSKCKFYNFPKNEDIE
jgi:hypothetical protein